MSGHDPLNRREFIEKSTLLATAAGVVAGVRKAKAQINDSTAGPAKRVGLGFIGVGIRGTLLMEAAAGIVGADIVACADCYQGHLARAKEHFPQIATGGDFQQLISRSDIDAVIIAAPDHWHLPMTRAALAAGKHVYCEKPMSHAWEEGDEFIKAVEKSGKLFQVGSQYVSMGCAEKAREFIQSGKLGQVTLVEGKIHRNSSTGAWYYPIPPDASPSNIDYKSFLGSAPQRDFDLRRFFQWRLFWDYSGGLPTDLFVHLITATHQLMGVQEPNSVFSFGDIYRWKNYREVPDQMTSLVTYDEGFVLKLTSTAENGHPGPALTFYGTEGTLEYDGEAFKYFYEPRTENFEYPTHSWAKATVDSYRDIMHLNDKLSPLDGPPAAEVVEYKAPNDEDSTRAHIRNWVEAIRGNGKIFEDVRFGHHAATVGHMCNLSFKSGKPVKWNKKTQKVEA